MLQFQPLYVTMPADIAWSEILIACAETDKKSKAKAASAKQKDKTKRQLLQQSYDPSLVCYFNPTEYAAAMGLYTGPAAAASGDLSASDAAADNSKAVAAAPALSPIEEAVIAKRRLATYVHATASGVVCRCVRWRA